MRGTALATKVLQTEIHKCKQLSGDKAGMRHSKQQMCSVLHASDFRCARHKHAVQRSWGVTQLDRSPTCGLAGHHK